uniref:hypothetical protein n=1 Tax=Ningiella ruwaisensis TaxID=2364274 RepID=UPI0010A04714|nr:hypothetical protein [Ningiella ruwaisensis]
MSGKTRRLKTIIAIYIATLLSACAVPTGSDIFSQTPDKDYSDMYLRGIFNWWEAREDYKLNKVDGENDLYQVDIELIADGQPYDFKLADAQWSPAYNCGLPSLDEALELEQDIELYCFSDSLNLQFIPNETGVYRFALDTSNNQYPELRITLVES